jgi:hypothetical protein
VNRRLPGAVVRLLVALAALGGALLSSGAVSKDETTPAKASPTAVATVTAAAPARLQRALPPAAEQLVRERRAGRKRLAAAHRPDRQEAAANALAETYHRVTVRLAKPAQAASATNLLAALARAEHGYRQLATSVRQHDRQGYKAARREIAAAERQLPKAFSSALANVAS